MFEAELKENKSKMKNRFTFFCQECCTDSGTVFVFSLACTVTDFYSFEGEKIKLYRAGVSKCANHVKG